MSQFCGQEAWCNNFNSERAMMVAMRRVEDQYLVVGVTEMWEETLKVLEHLLPAFFRGALQMYRSKGRTKINRNNIKVSFCPVFICKLFFQPFVSDDIRNLVARNNSKEVSLYCKSYCISKGSPD